MVGKGKCVELYTNQSKQSFNTEETLFYGALKRRPVELVQINTFIRFRPFILLI